MSGRFGNKNFLSSSVSAGSEARFVMVVTKKKQKPATSCSLAICFSNVKKIRPIDDPQHDYQLHAPVGAVSNVGAV